MTCVPPPLHSVVSGTNDDPDHLQRDAQQRQKIHVVTPFPSRTFIAGYKRIRTGNS
jgi:hypothetical protein